MHATRPPSIVPLLEIRNATQFFGHGAGRWLAAQEQQLSAIADAELALLLKRAGVSITSPSVLGWLRHTVGAVLVRIGLHLQATTDRPALATTQ